MMVIHALPFVAGTLKKQGFRKKLAWQKKKENQLKLDTRLFIYLRLLPCVIMLPEIIAIIYLSKNVREVAKEKGLNPTPYIAIAVVMLICLEIVGFIVGFIVVGNGWAIYPFALIGAGVGAYVGYSFVKSAIPKSHQ